MENNAPTSPQSVELDDLKEFKTPPHLFCPCQPSRGDALAWCGKQTWLVGMKPEPEDGVCAKCRFLISASEPCPACHRVPFWGGRENWD